MSILNDANPGSSIPTLCALLRFLVRNDGEYNSEEVANICRPANIIRNNNQPKKVPETIKLWSSIGNPLWSEGLREERGADKLSLTIIPNGIDQGSLSSLVHQVLTCDQDLDLFSAYDFSGNRNTIEAAAHAFICICEFLALATSVSDLLTKKEGERLCSFPGLKVKAPNSNESEGVQLWGMFLGYFELNHIITSGSKSQGVYRADPTRALARSRSGGK